jgi:hypothetical protein
MEYTSLFEGVSVMDSVPNHNNTLNPWTLMNIVAYKEILNPNLTSFAESVQFLRKPCWVVFFGV